jgi:hypothetical protein
MFSDRDNHLSRLESCEGKHRNTGNWPRTRREEGKMPSLYRPESRSDPYDASVRNLAKARASRRYHPPLPWRSKEESEMIRRFVFQWFTCHDRNRPSGRDWARQLGISHTWLQRLVREFEIDAADLWRLQAAWGDPSLAELQRAKESTEELRKEGRLRSRRRPKRVNLDE